MPRTLVTSWKKIINAPIYSNPRCIRNHLLRDGVWHMPTKRTSYGINVVSNIGQRIHGIIWTNGMRFYTTKAINVAWIHRWFIHSLVSSERCSNTTRSHELNPTIYKVHYGERTKQQVILPWCINNSHKKRIQVIRITKANFHRTVH